MTNTRGQISILRGRKVFYLAFLFFLFDLNPSAYSRTKNDKPTRIDNVAAGSVEKIYQDGVRYLEAGDYNKALAELERALARIQQKSVIDNEFFADIFYALSSAYYEKGVYPFYQYREMKFFAKSVEMASQCLRFNPRYWQAYENLGKVYLKLGEYDKADSYFALAEELVTPGSRQAAYIARQRKKIQGVKKLKESKNLKRVLPEGESPYSQHPILENPPVPRVPEKNPEP